MTAPKMGSLQIGLNLLRDALREEMGSGNRGDRPMKKRWLLLALPMIGMGVWEWRSDFVQDEITAARSHSGQKVTNSPYPMQVYWGDTHLHTSNSPDAFGFGTRLQPEDALRFARGEEVTSTTGVKAQLARPLDFLMIADHSDGLGFSQMLHDTPRFLLPNDRLKRWHDLFHSGPEDSQRATAEMIDLQKDPLAAKSLADPVAQAKRALSIWKASIRTVERYNEPGKFTALIGYEYTSAPNGNNLHRVVMYRDDFRKGSQLAPFTASTSTAPEALWDWMDAYEKRTGGKVLAIPHNSNVSGGLMFPLDGPDGQPMTAEQARRRAAHEPVVEATQIKGDSETHPFLSANDEFADFGRDGWDKSNLTASIPTTPNMYPGSYVRSALLRGLAIQKRTGVNPYQFGLIGSTDSHTSLTTGDEDNFFGKHSGNEPAKDRASKPMNLGTREGRYNWHYLAGGYAGVWATSNTREAIFDAFMRREVYATTGPRMTVRVFGGWDFADTLFAGDWVKLGYDQGVPMGGSLKPGVAGKAPAFIVAALKDPIGANLDRVQMIKGWYGSDGQLHEKVFDIAFSDPITRALRGGKVAPVGNTVDLNKATYANTIGAPTLRTVWRDPEFNAAERAFYYVRVIEIPTPRWLVFDALRYGSKVTPEMRPIAQERAYTSPIWYEPTGKSG